MTTGIITGMSNGDYHATDAISNSIISSMARSPAHCWALHIDPSRPARIATPAMMAGTLAHCAILEPEAMQVRYTTRPAGIDLRTTDGKAWDESVPAGVEVITNDQTMTADRQRLAVMANPEMASLFALGEAEQSAFWRDEGTGLLCKCRPDWVHPLADGRVMLVDVKTATDASPQEFSRTVWKYGYHRQAAWYSMGYQQATGKEVAGFVFAVVTNAHPFIAAAHMLDDEYFSMGDDECRSLLDIYAECKAAGKWPAFSGVSLLSPPAWARTSEEVEIAYV